MSFRQFFHELWGCEPFPWQDRLANQVMQSGWPASIGLPTAAGKTALIDIAVFVLAKQHSAAARRIFFVVDRRIIVDEAALRAKQISDKLAASKSGTVLGPLAEALRRLADSEMPLAVSTLRGGIRHEETWASSPRQPVIVCSTVDQIGSSLLFHAYGRSNYQWPIRAALAANDSLIILDEAHTSQPFAETLSSIQSLSKWGKTSVVSPLQVVEMSATPRGGSPFQEENDDRSHPILERRWTAQKRAHLLDPTDNHEFLSAVVREAQRIRDSAGARVIGVIVNRVRTARQVFDRLRNENGSRAILLTGRARPYDRDRLWEAEKPVLQAGSDLIPPAPLFVVSTQCIEVGADISFDALVTEIASIDALEQRFGRLDRTGSRGVSEAAILARKEQIKANAIDPVYGSAITKTWKWLEGRQIVEQRDLFEPSQGKKKGRSQKVKERFVNMAVLPLREALRTLSSDERKELVMPRASAPVLMPAHLDLLCQTSPEPAAVPDVSLYLHGPDSGPADVEIIWRADLDITSPNAWADAVTTVPPAAAEAIQVPVWAAREWLLQKQAADFTDVEGEPEPEPERKLPPSQDCRPFLIWRSAEQNPIEQSASKLLPGSRIVVPSGYGGCDEWGWNPEYQQPVQDVADAVNFQSGELSLRLHPDVASQWNYGTLANDLRPLASITEVRQSLRDYNQLQTLNGWPALVVAGLAKAGKLKLVSNDDGVLAILAKRSLEFDSRFSQYTEEITLDGHLGGVTAWVARFASHLPKQICDTLTQAALVHDIGKADPRFQALLRGGIWLATLPLLAKSGRNGNNSAAVERARKSSGYPKGCRHELLSVAMFQEHRQSFPEMDFDLLLHLVGSHHGRCRPFAPAIPDVDGPQVSYQQWSAPADHRLADLGSGVSERFWKLTRVYGWFGLAYLEAILRLADARCSQEEQLPSA